MRHPGPALEPRVVVEKSPLNAEFRVVLATGTDLLDGISEALARTNARSAGIRFASGLLASCRFVTGVPDPTGFRIATHSLPNDLVGPVLLLSGGAILGIDERGQPCVHCHAMFIDRDGEVRSGHLIPGACTIAERDVEIWVTSTGKARFEVRFDDETNFPLMHPGRWG
tara:strand:- start:753 stop:1259 length:507 start_codon:yes stop_codon:yes gene_type:complete